MRLSILLAAAVAMTSLAATPAEADQRRGRDQDRAYLATQSGRILPLSTIRSAVRIPGAQYIGAELVRGGLVYRLKYMRGSDVIWVDVDARTGRILGQVR